MSNGIIVDNGTSMMKAGYSGDDAPRCVFPSTIGYKNYLYFLQYRSDNEFIGSVEEFEKTLKIEKVFSKGKIINFDHYEALLNHTFYNELRIDPKENALVSSETTGTEARERHKKTQIIFEKFDFPGFYLSNDNVAALVCHGKTTGTVLNVGYEHSSCTPIYECEVLSHAVNFGEIGGIHISNYLDHLLKKHNLYFKDPYLRMETVNKIKEKICSISVGEDENYSEMFELPDGKMIELDRKTVMAPDLLLEPSLFNIDDEPIDQKIISSITKSYSFLEKSLAKNVILSGSSTMFPGLQDRMLSGLRNRFSSDTKVKLETSYDRRYLVWNGMSAMSSFLEGVQYMTIEEYQEYGSFYVETKFPSTFSKYQQCYLKYKKGFKEVLDVSSRSGNIFFQFE